MTDIQSWSPTASQNTDPAPDGFPEDIPLRDVDDSAREVMAAVRRQWNDAEWFNYGSGDKTPAYNFVSGTVFKVVGGSGEASEYHQNRRVRAVGAATGSIYGTIQSSVANGSDLDVTVAWDTGSLNDEPLTLFLSILKADNPGLPEGTTIRPAKVVVQDGSAAAPSIHGATDVDTGLFFEDGRLGVAVGGNSLFSVSGDGTVESRFFKSVVTEKTGIPEDNTTDIVAVELNVDDIRAHVRVVLETGLAVGVNNFRFGAGTIEFLAYRQSNNNVGFMELGAPVADGPGTPTPSGLSLSHSGNRVNVRLTINNNGTFTTATLATIRTEIHSRSVGDIDVVSL